MLFYLDECYNTGNNWLDESQMFFTYGGWMIHEADLVKAESLIRDFQKYHQGELKSKSFVSHKGIREISELLKNIINDCNANPYFICFEKKYMIACKIVEIFFDHATNKKVNGYLTFPNQFTYYEIIKKKENIKEEYSVVKNFLPPIYETKNGLAELIYEDDDLCSYVGNILSRKITDKKCVENVINKINVLFQRLHLNDISDIFNVANFEVNDIYKELMGKNINDNKDSTQEAILVKPSLYEMICNLKNSNSELKLIVDTIGVQNSQFSEISKLLNIPIDIKEESENDVMIMSADLLVGYLARTINNIIFDKDVTEKDIELLKELFVPSLSSFDDNFTMWNYKISNNSGNKLLKKMGFVPEEFDYINMFKSNFEVFLNK